jgi:hypothetical protein
MLDPMAGWGEMFNATHNEMRLIEAKWPSHAKFTTRVPQVPGSSLVVCK